MGWLHETRGIPLIYQLIERVGVGTPIELFKNKTTTSICIVEFKKFSYKLKFTIVQTFLFQNHLYTDNFYNNYIIVLNDALVHVHSTTTQLPLTHQLQSQGEQLIILLSYSYLSY